MFPFHYHCYYYYSYFNFHYYSYLDNYWILADTIWHDRNFVIYLNIIATIDLRFTIISIFIMAVICQIFVAIVFLVNFFEDPFCKLNSELK